MYVLMYLYEWILVCNCTLQNTFYFVSWALGRVQHRPCIIFNIWKVEWILHLACLRSINPAATTSESQIIFILSRASSSLSWACKTFILFVVCPIALRWWVPLLDFIHFNWCQKLLTIKTILIMYLIHLWKPHLWNKLHRMWVHVRLIYESWCAMEL